MIIGRDLMVQLGLTADFKRQSLLWYGAIVPMKEPSGMLGKSDLSQREMREVVIHILKLASTRDYTERLVKILDITYNKSYLNQVADNSTQMNSEEITQLLKLLKYFQDLFDGTLGD